MSVPFRIGLLRLADSLPILMAHEKNLFAQADIEADIVVEPSWANIADGLSWGRLDAAVVFPPLAIMTYLGKRGRPTPLRVVADLSFGGNTIVLRDQTYLERSAPCMAVVHPYSTHFLLLRRYLLAQCPRALEHLIIMPPDMMLEALANRTIDGFCAGPPWGTAAEQAGLGRIVSGSAAIKPGHLEKQCVVTETWAERHPVHAMQLTRVLKTSIAHCLDPAEHETSLGMLSRPVDAGGLALPTKAVQAIMPSRIAPHAIELGRSHDQSIDWIAAEMQALSWINADDDLLPWSK
ncbi:MULTISPECIES: ABC transporter substrate-binding protein [Asaia]|uniref:Nitrate transport tauA n=1 Tax=Asaia bogorensis TaxID=91915 RepID=A0A060QF36_9PROT|nr:MULTISPECIES: ABC transporter substrate-binding protein [Asaia]ETC99238.1 nitrate ABC transporter ATP-binding protein [Asaia sp. SF2.1]CDG39699.1 nitrate transport tauA [Asaia bogorensis]